jgi:protein gp37
MADKTLIAWTDHTFNIAWGCMKVSPGCKHCYAETLSANPRFGGDTRPTVWGPNSDRRTFGPEHWHNPVKWNRAAAVSGTRHRVFSSSMCDVFEDHPTIDAERAKLWTLIDATPHLDWQILTKRADRIAANLPPHWGAGWPNVWLGVSIENNDYVSRADHLRAVNAAVRFISYEPALGPLDALNLDGIDWLIFGGESGPGYRPMDVQWARDIRARCEAAGTAFFFKQSAAPRTEMGTTLDGQLVRAYPVPRRVGGAAGVTAASGGRRRGGVGRGPSLFPGGTGQ